MTSTTESFESHLLTDPSVISEFLTAGNAIFTLRSIVTSKRHTFRVTHKEFDNGREFWFVSSLTGPSNESDYHYLGSIINDGGVLAYRLSAKSPSANDVRHTIITWMVRQLSKGSWPSEKCEFWHEGRCGKCGRRLTDPESIKTGLGPICSGLGKSKVRPTSIKFVNTTADLFD